MDPESWSPLHIFVGSTTYPPEDVLLPRMMFISADRHQSVVPESDVQVRVATKLHLPYRRKDGVGKDTAILRTALSFQALRKHQENLPRYVLPRFCFFVKRGVVASHFSLIHYDVVDPLRLLSGPDVHRKTVSLQTSKLTSVEKYQRFALVRNMRVSHMESELTVEVKDRTVYPVTMCGSLRSLRMTFRGTHGVAMDEPESQQQYFFGPYGRNGSIFKYGWRPFHTAPFNLTNVYVVYVLSSDDRPKISVRDMELVQFPEWSKPSYWIWRFHYERFSWIATASTYSAGAKFLSNYALLFLYLIAIFHSPYMLGEGGTSPGRGALYRVFYAKPVVATMFVGITMEMLSSYIASQALEVCLQEERPQFSDEDLSAMMGVTEKLVLMFLYGLPPRYDACKYSWIRMATILPFDVAADQVVHVVFGYCCVVMLLLIGYGIYFLSWPLSRVLRPFLTWRLGGKVSVWPYILLWLFPIILHNTVLWMHVSLSTTIACLTAFAVIWSIPRGVLTDTNPRYHYICIISIFTIQLSTHLEGIAFVLRNYVMLPREVLDDFERFESLPEHIVAFTVGQMCLAVIYGTTYLTLLHHEGVVAHGDTKRQAKLEKNNRVGDVGDSVENGKGDGKKVGVEGNTVTNGVPCSLLRGDTTYVIGDMGRQYPALRVFAQVGSWGLAIVTGWVCLVALRRPLEGTVALFGMCMVSAYLALVLLRFW
uniref:Transmembrane protein n=1 Tax=Trypanosoma congolense (strain IL3000) TaxID=1068625 RepID=G0UUD5_TRYCI|nr:conserved hypothetical protein [Trypanosoma congolense IL3000]